MLHPDFDYALGKERVVQIRAEVERSRLEARLARETRSEETGSGEGTVLRRGMATRGAGFVAALFRLRGAQS